MGGDFEVNQVGIYNAQKEALAAARNYIKLLEMKGAGPIAVGLAKANFQEKEKALRNVQV